MRELKLLVASSRRTSTTVAACRLVFLCITVLPLGTGCGSSDPELLPAAPAPAAQAPNVASTPSPNTPPAATPQSSPVEPRHPQPGGAPQDIGPLAENASPQGTSGNGAAAEKEEVAKARPEDVAQWSFEDFSTARVDGDERLLEAVEHMVTSRGDEDEVIHMLVSLLAIDPPEEKDENDDANQQAVPGQSPFTRQLSPGPQYGRPGASAQELPPVKHRFVVPEVAARIIQGLGPSKSAVATESLKNLLLGKQVAPLGEQDIAALSIRSLGANVDSARESLLLGLLRNPAVAKPAKFDEPNVLNRRGFGGPANRGVTYGGPLGSTPIVPSRGARPGQFRNVAAQSKDGELNPEWIQVEVMGVAGKQFSRDSRNKLAKHLKSSDVVLETAQIVEQLLLEDDPRNDPAQILLLTNPYTEQPTRDQIEEVLIESSSKSLLEMLDLSESSLTDQSFGSRGGGRFGGRPFGSPNTFNRSSATQSNQRQSRASRNAPSQTQPMQNTNRPASRIDPEERRKQQRQLIWRAKVVGLLAKTLENKELKNANSRLPLLMGTIPLVSARESFRSVLAGYQGKDPDSLFKMGIFSSTTIDPASLIFAKQLYHGKKQSGSDAGQSQPSDAWSQRLEPFIADMCERLQEASDVGDGKVSRKKFPVRLHSGGKAVARYDLVWPTDVEKRWKRFKIAPLELHYIRLEEESTANQTVYHYRHHNKEARETKISDGVWFDGFDSRHEMSIDVRITTPNGDLGVPVGSESQNGQRGNRGRAGKRGERKTIFIEVLTVAIPQPEETS